MNKKIRLATNDKVEIIDRKSPYFSKTGTCMDLRSQPLRIFDIKGKPISSTTIFHVSVMLNETKTTEVFTLEQVRKIS